MNLKKQKIMILLILFLAVSVFCITGCSSNKKDLRTIKPLDPNTEIPEPSGGYTISVCGQTLSSEEIVNPILSGMTNVNPNASYNQFQQRARPIVERLTSRKITSIILYEYAKNDLPDNVDEFIEKAVDDEVKKFLMSFGNDYSKAERALNDMGLDWQGFREYQQKMLIRQSYMANQHNPDQPVTYNEMQKEYEEMKQQAEKIEPTIQFSLIDIRAEKLNIDDPNLDRQKEAKKLADAVMKKLNKGKDFSELAKKYSHGYRRRYGGQWEHVSPSSLAAPYDKLAEKLMKHETGEIVGPVNIDGRIFIAKIDEKKTQAIEPFEKIQKEIEAKIRFERQKEKMDEIGQQLIAQADLPNKERFIDFCTRKLYQKVLRK